MNTTESFMKPDVTFGETLRITAYAYAKLLWMRDRGNTEVAAFATTATKDPLLVTDFRLIKQKCTNVTFDLDTDDLVEDVEKTLDEGLSPWMTHNILCHTHPGNCPNPSLTDEENFKQAFSHPNWAIMLIIAQDGSTYCRLKINTAPGVEKLLRVQIDFTQEFTASDHTAWEKEYKEKVKEVKFRMTGKEIGLSANALDEPLWNQRDDFSKPIERQQETVENCAADFYCYFDDDGNVSYYDDEDNLYFVYDPASRQWFEESCINDDLEKIDKPRTPWADKVMDWAIKHDQEHQLIVEKQS